MKFKLFSAINRARCESPSGFDHSIESWTSSDWMVAVLGELGEAANVVKKLNRLRDGIPGNKLEETKEFLHAKLRKEIADTLSYLDLFAQSVDVDLMEATIDKFNEVSERIGYPLVVDQDGGTRLVRFAKKEA